MASQLAQILDAIDAVLVAHAPTGTTVDQDRADAHALEEAPSFNLLAHNVAREPLGTGVDRCEAEIELRINVRAASCTAAAEALHETVHAPLMQDAALHAVADSVLLTSEEFERQEADNTSLIKSARYRVIYSVERSTQL